MSFNHLDYLNLVKTIEVIKRIGRDYLESPALERAIREGFLNLKPQSKIAPKFEDGVSE